MRRQRSHPGGQHRNLIPITVSRKKAFALRIDEDKLAALEKWAADEFRSTNGHLEWLIDKALKEAGRKKKSAKAPDDNSSSEDSKE